MVGPDPIAVAASLRARGPIALLDASSDADGLGRFSYIGAVPVGAVFAWGDRVLHIDEDGRRVSLREDPLAALTRRVKCSISATSMPPFPSLAPAPPPPFPSSPTA